MHDVNILLSLDIYYNSPFAPLDEKESLSAASRQLNLRYTRDVNILLPS